MIVSRRAGGLEIIMDAARAVLPVSRRAGGLEKASEPATRTWPVSRRAGGLEMMTLPVQAKSKVSRRAGGLEIVITVFATISRVNRRIGGLKMTGSLPNVDLPHYGNVRGRWAGTSTLMQGKIVRNLANFRALPKLHCPFRTVGSLARACGALGRDRLNHD